MEKKTLPEPLNIKDQIANLKSIGLIIEDVGYASSMLDDISYFRLVKAYSIGLKEKNGCYYKGVTFEQLVELYLFNANFRQLTFAQIEKIEVNLRSRLSNYFSTKYGVLGYLDSANFADQKYFEKFLQEIEREVNNNRRAPYIKNFQENYIDGQIPFYALVEVFSFGTLSKFLKNMKPEDKTALAKQYGIPYTFLESWIESLSYVRNVCAHYGRLYNAKLTKTPKLFKKYREQNISSIRIFGILCCMKHLLPGDEHWKEYVDTLASLFEKYPHVDISTMGFPENWRFYWRTNKSESNLLLKNTHVNRISLNAK